MIVHSWLCEEPRFAPPTPCLIALMCFAARSTFLARRGAHSAKPAIVARIFQLRNLRADHRGSLAPDHWERQADRIWGALQRACWASHMEREMELTHLAFAVKGD